MSSYDKILICTLNRRNKRSASGCDDDRIRFIEFDQFCIGGCIQKDLRDYYPSLDALCDDMDVSREVLEEKLGMIDYRYDAEKNQFE